MTRPPGGSGRRGNTPVARGGDPLSGMFHSGPIGGTPINGSVGLGDRALCARSLRPHSGACTVSEQNQSVRASGSHEGIPRAVRARPGLHLPRGAGAWFVGEYLLMLTPSPHHSETCRARTETCPRFTLTRTRTQTPTRTPRSSQTACRDETPTAGATFTPSGSVVCRVRFSAASCA